MAKLNPATSTIAFSTYLGGTGGDWTSALALDAAGNIYVAGITYSPDFPTARALQPNFSGGDNGWGGSLSDAFVAKIKE